jgi:hypothetical protein
MKRQAISCVNSDEKQREMFTGVLRLIALQAVYPTVVEALCNKPEGRGFQTR